MSPIDLSKYQFDDSIDVNCNLELIYATTILDYFYSPAINMCGAGFDIIHVNHLPKLI